MKKVVVGLGECLWDCLPTGKVLGGAPANFAYHASQLDCEGVAVSAIGKDELGDEILSQLADKGLENIISRVDYPTGTVKVTLDAKGVPNYEIVKNVAWDYIPFGEAEKELASRADAICFGSLAQRNEVSRKSMMDFIAAAPKGCLKVFDINLRQKFYSLEIIDASLKVSDILKINDEEVDVVKELMGIEGSQADVCCEIQKRYNLDMVILTKGENGSEIFSAKGLESSLPTPKVVVADTVGAGDSFTAAFIASYLNGKSIKECHEIAVNVSAFVCTKKGAMPKLEM